jgi:MFS family permease
MGPGPGATLAVDTPAVPDVSDPVAGAVADTLDRRRLLYGATTLMAVFAGVLALVSAVGTTGPGLLLVITFLLGCGTALTNPAWQAIQPDLVPANRSRTRRRSEA